jgi:hypothetical protein
MFYSVFQDNVSDIVKEGGVQRLQDGDLIVQVQTDLVINMFVRCLFLVFLS